MNIIDLIPGGRMVQMLVLAAIAAAVIGAVTWGVHSYNEGLRQDGRNEIQQKWDADVSRQKDEAIASGVANAKETQRRLERQGDAQREQQAELQRYARAAADARTAARGFELRVDQLSAAAKRGASDTATAGERQAGAAAAGVLAELSRGSDALAELYARTADSARRAGLLCERTYDALTVKP